MRLLDLWQVSTNSQMYHVYITNNYDQNLPVYHGTIVDLCMDDEYGGEWFDSLDLEIEVFYVCKNGDIQVQLKDEHFFERVEDWWTSNKSITDKWDDLNPETRPWRYSLETESMAHICGGNK